MHCPSVGTLSQVTRWLLRHALICLKNAFTNIASSTKLFSYRTRVHVLSKSLYLCRLKAIKGRIVLTSWSANFVVALHDAKNEPSVVNLRKLISDTDSTHNQYSAITLHLNVISFAQGKLYKQYFIWGSLWKFSAQLIDDVDPLLTIIERVIARLKLRIYGKRRATRMCYWSIAI